jgi:AraC-like DNA-binding protein
VGEISEEHRISAGYTQHVIALLERFGVTEQELFAGSPLRTKDFHDPSFRIRVPTAIALLERARQLSQEPALGFYLGLQMSIAAHGHLSFLAMCAPTLRDALVMAVRFVPLRNTAIALRLEVTGDSAALVVEERADFGSARDVLLLSTLIGIWQLGNVVLGRELKETIVELMLKKPAWYARFEGVYPRVRFACAANRLVFEAAMLDTRLVSADSASFRLVREQCEQLLAAANAKGRLIERLRRFAISNEAGVRSFDDVAAALNMSPRTLRRQLSRDGISYSSLVEEERRTRASSLLSSSALSIKEIAARLGYSDVANFTRAFRRWSGQTPSEFRKGS